MCTFQSKRCDFNPQRRTQLPGERKHTYHVMESKPYVLLDMDSFVTHVHIGGFPWRYCSHATAVVVCSCVTFRSHVGNVTQRHASSCPGHKSTKTSYESSFGTEDSLPFRNISFYVDNTPLFSVKWGHLELWCWPSSCGCCLEYKTPRILWRDWCRRRSRWRWPSPQKPNETPRRGFSKRRRRWSLRGEGPSLTKTRKIIVMGTTTVPHPQDHTGSGRWCRSSGSFRSGERFHRYLHQEIYPC